MILENIADPAETRHRDGKAQGRDREHRYLLQFLGRETRRQGLAGMGVDGAFRAGADGEGQLQEAPFACVARAGLSRAPPPAPSISSFVSACVTGAGSSEPA